MRRKPGVQGSRGRTVESGGIETLAEMTANGEVAPIPVTRPARIERVKPTHVGASDPIVGTVICLSAFLTTLHSPRIKLTHTVYC
jgi:hypothetical protein